MYQQIDLFNSREMHQNSIKTYIDKILPNVSGRKLEVLNTIKSLGGTCTLYEIGIHLNRPLNTFSGRISELRKLGLIEDTKQIKKHGESNFTIWKVVQ